MSLIIAGHFPTKSRADLAVETLLASGVRHDSICTFALNPPGQHAKFPIGGDHDESKGAAHAGRSAATGAAVGGVVGAAAGVAAAAAVGPVAIVGGAAVGAYLGSLAGALDQLGSPQANTFETDEQEVHAAGVLLAVNVPPESSANAEPASVEQNRIRDILYSRGATEVERKQGIWQDGTWVDFDPTT